VALEIDLFFASMTGKAQRVAEAVANALASEARFRVRSTETLAMVEFAAARNLLMVSSTFGAGDLPEMGQRLFAELLRAQPSMTGTRFGVIGLGDSSYIRTYGFGGRRWRALLLKLGAREVSELFLIDALGDEGQEARALDWARRWLAALGAPAVAGEQPRPEPAARTPE